uniref:Uncharacterized protein n=1 Tax=Hippocampus comes TaxID=109280 RepID=A0A3Q2XYX0_HIPCM
LEAIVNNHVEVARYLIQNGACVYHEDGYTGLHHAAKQGNLEIVNTLLETGQVDVNAQDSGGWTPIIWAAEHKHVEVIKVLLNRGADVTINDKVIAYQDTTKTSCYVSRRRNEAEPRQQFKNEKIRETVQHKILSFPP